ncbi:MAG: amidohydrolase family protein [Candidatus Gracilibacteria bacterium]|jgi:predicted TIM-barrel fold metal-dependent hydrolase
MKNKINFLKHPVSGLVLIAIVTILVVFSVMEKGNSLSELDPNDYMIIDVHENLESEDSVENLVSVMNAANIAKMVLSAAPEEIFNYTGEKGFTNSEGNNETVLSVAKKYDNRFYAFCTIDPDDSNKVATAMDCVKEGADGFKLYNGHSFFYSYALDDDRMLGLYKYMEEKGLPVIFHVNTGNYLEQFENVLTLYPDMKVICPHFCLSSKNPSQLATLLATYPNLYVDISFGYKDYLASGLQRISDNVDVFKQLFAKYPDRFLFGTVAVVEDNDAEKDEEWLIDTYQTYRDVLEKNTYTTFYVADETTGEEVLLNGLALDAATLEKIYETNWEKLMGDR